MSRGDNETNRVSMDSNQATVIKFIVDKVGNGLSFQEARLLILDVLTGYDAQPNSKKED